MTTCLEIECELNTSSFQLERLRTGLKPFRLHFFPRLRSTNDHAALLRKRGNLFAPAILLTPHQITRRGPRPNTWWPPEGPLPATLALPTAHTPAPHPIPLLARLHPPHT